MFFSLIVILFRILFKSLFLKFRTILAYELSIFSLALDFVGIKANIKEVGKTSSIICYDYASYKEGYLVKTLNENLTLPLNGLIIYKNNAEIKIDIGSNIIYTIRYLIPEVVLYQKINDKTILGKTSTYYIYSNNKDNVAYLNYQRTYETI